MTSRAVPCPQTSATLSGFNQSLTEVWNGSDWTQSVTNQRFDSNSQSYSVNARTSYTEPLTDKLFLELSYGYSWRRNNQTKDTYDSFTNAFSTDEDGNNRLIYDGSNETAMRNDIYSRNIENSSQNHRGGSTLQYQNRKFRAQIGGQYMPTITDNVTQGRDPYHSIKHNWAPQAMVSYEPNKNSEISFYYRGRSGYPSTNHLIPVPDNSNPLHVSFGNPMLTSYFNHRLNGRFGYTNRETFFAIRGNIDATLVQDGISNAQWYDDAGVQYSMPMNGPLTGSASFNYFLNSPIAKSNFSVSNMAFVNYNTTAAYVGRDAKTPELTAKYYDSVTAEFDYQLFNEDFFAKGHPLNLDDYFLSSRNHTLSVTERIKFTYRNDFVEVSAAARTRFTKPWYSM